MRYKEFTIEGRNAVLEAFRSGKTIDKLFVLDGCQDGPVKSIIREAKKTDTIRNVLTGLPEQDTIRVLLHRRQHMNMQKLKIY